MRRNNFNSNRPKKDKEPSFGLGVVVRNDDINGAIRKFKKKVQESGILQEYRKKQEYEKPSAKRKRLKAAARARHLKALAKRKAELGF